MTAFWGPYLTLPSDPHTCSVELSISISELCFSHLSGSCPHGVHCRRVHLCRQSVVKSLLSLRGGGPVAPPCGPSCTPLVIPSRSPPAPCATLGPQKSGPVLRETLMGSCLAPKAKRSEQPQLRPSSRPLESGSQVTVPAGSRVCPSRDARCRLLLALAPPEARVSQRCSQPEVADRVPSRDLSVEFSNSEHWVSELVCPGPLDDHHEANPSVSPVGLRLEIPMPNPGAANSIAAPSRNHSSFAAPSRNQPDAGLDGGAVFGGAVLGPRWKGRIPAEGVPGLGERLELSDWISETSDNE